MNLLDLIRSEEGAKREKFLIVFRDMNKESGPLLRKQLEDRLHKNRKKLNHTRSREAALKDKLTAVVSAIAEADAAGVDSDSIEVLEAWREEVLKMLNKIDCVSIEEKRRDLLEIREKIKKRMPILTQVIGEFGDGTSKGNTR